MDQSDALTGQEAASTDNQAVNQKPEEQAGTNNASMEVLLQDAELDFPKQGEIRSGVVASITDNEILVSIGTKSEGVISGREKEQIPREDLEKLTIGMEIPVYVLNPEDQNGTLVLSYLRAREEQDWQFVEEMLRSAKPFDSKVIGYNKGGLIVPMGNLRGFVPASQVSVMRRAEASGDNPDARWSKMVGEPIRVQVIEVDRQRHRLILSERVALQETRETIKERLLDELSIGDVRTGRVTSLADFGAFVNINGADGLVHLSEVSWERIEHPSDVLKVGQEVEVKVIAIDQERKRIGLSIRQLQPDPWLKKVGNLKEGQLTEGIITHLTKFGAFAKLGDDLEGLIHISELSETRINHPKEVVKEGDTVTLRVIKIDAERRRIGLSLRKVDSPQYADLDWRMALSDEVVEAAHASHETAGEALQTETELPVESLTTSEESQPEPEVEIQPEPEVESKPELDVVDENQPIADVFEENKSENESAT